MAHITLQIPKHCLDLDSGMARWTTLTSFAYGYFVSFESDGIQILQMRAAVRLFGFGWESNHVVIPDIHFLHDMSLSAGSADISTAVTFSRGALAEELAPANGLFLSLICYSLYISVWKLIKKDKWDFFFFSVTSAVTVHNRLLVKQSPNKRNTCLIWQLLWVDKQTSRVPCLEFHIYLIQLSTMLGIWLPCINFHLGWHVNANQFSSLTRLGHQSVQ